MTLADLKSACARARANRASIDMDPNDAHLVLVLPGERRRARARVLPGVIGRVVGTDVRGGKPFSIVDVLVTDVERALRKVGA